MSRRFGSVGLLFCLAVVGLTSEALQAQTVDSQTVDSPTVDSLVARHIEARGGAERLETIQTLSMSGRATTGPGREALVSRLVRSPGRIRTEFVAQGVTAVFACDGSKCWYVDPMAGVFDAELMSPMETALAMEEADVLSAIDWKEKGHRLELMGNETIDAREVYKLKVTLAGGAMRTVYVDVESALVVRRETPRTFGDQTVEVQTNYGDFKPVEGIVFPHSIRSGAKGLDKFLDVTVEKIEINVPVDDSSFQMPDGGSGS